MIAQLAERRYPLWLIRVLRIALFAAFIAISARISIPIPGTPVRFTMQVLSVLLSGMILGSFEGAMSVIAYLGAIALNLPLDSGWVGSLAFVGPSAGFLIGFVPAAAIAGLGGRITHERWKLVGLLLFVLLAVLVLHIIGFFGLLAHPVTGGSWSIALSFGAVPFVFVDLGKVLLAASLVKLGRESWLRWLAPLSPNTGG
jgi:biotin transport system substrate-specific component